MALNQYSRTALVMGDGNLEKLRRAHVAVFGIGGVGGYVVEALARSGIGTLDLIDDDRICLTNLNRQILATRSSIGKYKVDAARERIQDIDPEIKVNTYKCFYLPEERDKFDFTQWDYIVDAIDTVTGKLDIISEAVRCRVPVISAMGCGNRIDPTKLVITDLYKTVNDPLAKVMRRECRKRGIRKLTVVYSTEPAIRPLEDESNSCAHHCICPPGTKRKCTQRRDIPGSTAFVPSAAGILIASRIVRDLTGFDGSERTKSAIKNRKMKEQENT
ncbi:MAG: tRNA threonylcarbamoyladenosine dehydratase [Lachnospiraceae bacterium]|nr:tRNA threonylcarbamoyladenosine dehydratase [Lachnospiraceae bacterium]MCH4030785.1 tRNA threonylcarbamoyladenosine dehydratase [Lachnospiraceae bacterium]MCH4070757.1 tRNA threonylcarbamoyladenosine dehydratase [Lachnospiraceae bacterium]MCH4107067.1 tRNA threonylcarbamoyladenosine dehydratase [Lachnospiraceae bacterium]MCI1302077.1 tRNA threonylcarbamoyladenosine dehydratase [Lachnospiraceae bacterium]